MTFEDLLRIRETCLTHAEGLITLAERIHGETDSYNISYHLAVLALEEIGKCIIIFNHHMGSELDESFSADGKWDDHEKKIFWAAFDPFWETAELNPDTIRDTQELAQRIHNLRLKCLYTDPWDTKALSPKLTVTSEEALRLISFAKTRLGIAREIEKPKELSEADRAALRWFINSIRNPERRNLVLGPKSRAMCKELGSTTKWIDWLKAQFDEAERKSLELTRKALSKHSKDDLEANTDKWRMKIKIFSDSHSVRAKELTWWNKGLEWIKLRDVHKKKGELIAEFTFPKSVALASLWGMGLHWAHRLLVGLNTASLGFFWWYLPGHTDRFFEDLRDLEEKSRVQISPKESLRIDWGQRVLTEETLRKASLVFTMLPKPDDEAGMLIYGHYLQGLAFISKNDLHLRLGPNAFLEFFTAFKLGTRYYGDWKGADPFRPSPHLYEVLAQKVGLELDRCIELGDALEIMPPSTSVITLNDVVEMKWICDVYIWEVLSRMAEERWKSDGHFEKSD